MAKQLELNFDAPPNPQPNQLLEPDEIFQLDDASALQLIEEDRRVERKRASASVRDLGEYVVMWANTQPSGGLIVVGMDDDGSISGCTRVSQDKINAIEKVADTYCPEARIQTRRIGATNSRGEPDYLTLILVRYRPDRLVQTTKGEAFMRVGDSKTKLSREQCREIEIDRGQIDLEQEPVTLSYPAEFDTKSIERFTQAVRNSRGLAESHTVEEILQLRHLGRIENGIFKPNRACALLFANDPRMVFPGCRIRFQRFEGEIEGTGEDFREVKDFWFEGTVPQIADEATRAIKTQLRDFSRLGPDGRFYTAPEYPEDAWYEAIINALVHRSYGLKNMHIQVKMFDDRLEVISPGGFPPLVTPENIYDIQQSRNPYLMDAMFYLDFVKMANEGTRRMRDKMEGAGLPTPDFQETKEALTRVKVTLRNNIKQRKVWVDADATHVVGEAIFAGLDQAEKRLVNWVAENGRINVSEALRVIDVKTWHSAKKKLMGLVEQGILEYRSTKQRDPNAHFVLKNGNS